MKVLEERLTYLFIVFCKDLLCIPFRFGSRTFICAFTIFCFPPSLTLFSCFHMGLVDLLISVFHLAFTRFESYGAPISGLLPWLFYLVVIVDSIFCFAVHLHFDLCFGGKGGCRACHMHLCQLGVQEVVVWTAFITSACHSEGSIFWARKSQEKLDTQIRAFPVAFFFPQARNTVRFTAFQQRRARFTAPQRCAYFTFCCCELGWRGSNSIRKAQRRRMPCPPVRQCWTSTLQ